MLQYISQFKKVLQLEDAAVRLKITFSVSAVYLMINDINLRRFNSNGGNEIL